MLFHLDIEHLHVQNYIKNWSKWSQKSQVEKPHAHTGICTMFVLSNSRPPVWGLSEQWNGSWTWARHYQEWDQKLLTHTFLSLCWGVHHLSYLQQSWNHLSTELSSWQRWTGAVPTLLEVIARSSWDNIYTSCKIYGAINQLVTLTGPNKWLSSTFV